MGFKIPRNCITRVKDRIPSFYIEHTKVSSKNNNIIISNKDGEHTLPVASIAVLLLGPGTSITHDAAQILSESGTLCAWSDSFGGNCHCYMIPDAKIWNDTSKNAEQQALIASNSKMRTKAVRKMFEIRYGEEYDHSKQRTIKQMMGMEGNHVRRTYETYASEYGIKWDGRIAKVSDMEDNDVANFIITMAMQELYNLITAICYSIGCVPSLGILHMGHSKSFIFDIADLWKERYVIPFAFERASKHRDSNIRDYQFKKKVRSDIRDFINSNRFAQKSIDAISDILWKSQDEDIHIIQDG